MEGQAVTLSAVNFRAKRTAPDTFLAQPAALMASMAARSWALNSMDVTVFAVGAVGFLFVFRAIGGHDEGRVGCCQEHQSRTTRRRGAVLWR